MKGRHNVKGPMTSEHDNHQTFQALQTVPIYNEKSHTRWVEHNQIVSFSVTGQAWLTDELPSSLLVISIGEVSSYITSLAISDVPTSETVARSFAGWRQVSGIETLPLSEEVKGRDSTCVKAMLWLLRAVKAIKNYLSVTRTRLMQSTFWLSRKKGLKTREKKQRRINSQSRQQKSISTSSQYFNYPRFHSKLLKSGICGLVSSSYWLVTTHTSRTMDFHPLCRRWM